MKKTLIYAIVIAICLTACTKPIEKAQMTAEHFWSVVHLHRLDSISILYPDFEKLHLVKSNLHCFSSETTEVIDLGNKCFEVRTDVKIRGTKDNPINYSLFVKRNEKKEYYIYDSRGLANLSNKESKKMIGYGCYEDGDIFAQASDQEIMIMSDSIVPKIDSIVADTVLAEIAKKLTGEYSSWFGAMLIKNNTHFDLSKISIIFKIDYGKDHHIKTKNTYWNTLKPGELGRLENENDGWFTTYKTNKIVGPMSITRTDAVKVYKPTGTEYQDYLASKNQQN